MNALQIGLAVLGALLLLAVLLHGLWTTRQQRPRIWRSDSAAGHGAGSPVPMPSGADADPLDNERIEPTLDTPSAVLAERAEPAWASPLHERRAALDPLIDAIAPLALDSVVSGDAVLAAMPGSRRVGSKPFFVEGLHAEDGQWETVRSGQRYSALQLGVQLANRAGALNDIEFSEFVVQAQAVADALGATPEFPEMRDEVARARELDQFASAHDALLTLQLRARRAAWSPGYVAQHAAALGFVAGALPGRMVLPSPHPGAAPWVGLQFDTQAALADDPEQTALVRVDLSLEVTHVPRGDGAYPRLCEAAQQLAQRMDGALTDERGQPLPAEALTRIGADLETLYDALDARDLAAGSVLARRLFS